MKEIFDTEVSRLAGASFTCNCGKVHTIDIKKILIGSGIVNDLGKLLKEYEGRKVFIVGDGNTYKAAGEKVENTLKEKFELHKYIFQEEHLIPDEKALGRLLVEIPEDTSVIAAVGSGTINDISRFLSSKLHIPYIIVCTAPSMDGYASVVSPLIIDNVKTTYNAVYPYAIAADIEIMKEAPMHMLHAGFGDILGKYTALADWHLAKILHNEYFCTDIEELVLKAVDKCVKVSGNILKRDSEVVENIAEALILTGLAIGMTGTSRPASGEEHHLSHCWEMVFMKEGKHTKWLHGNNVGVGVGIIIEAYRYLNSLNMEEIYASDRYKRLDKKKWADNLFWVYGRSAGNVIRAKEDSIAFDEETRERNMRNIMDNWENIKKIYSDFLPEPDEVRAVMERAGAVYSPQELGLDRETFKRSFIAAKDIRNRYGVLQLLEDIGMLEEAAEVVTNVYYK